MTFGIISDCARGKAIMMMKRKEKEERMCKQRIICGAYSKRQCKTRCRNNYFQVKDFTFVPPMTLMNRSTSQRERISLSQNGFLDPLRIIVVSLPYSYSLARDTALTHTLDEYKRSSCCCASIELDLNNKVNINKSKVCTILFNLAHLLRKVFFY